ncbi:hypothetical protein PENSPDRAFT_577463 [Peniophora sp. CONT]|nr:hypothetical protein PENSPDRAFT_577463 [Peniophora sp. CONT]
MKSFTTFATTVLVLAASAIAAPAPIQHAARDVWDPTILIPNATTVWEAGSTVNVTWATDDAPTNISNGAAIFLRDNTTLYEPALAEGFDLRSGSQEITLPANLTADSDFRIVLFGDSGNWSPEFTIVA